MMTLMLFLHFLTPPQQFFVGWWWGFLPAFRHYSSHCLPILALHSWPSSDFSLRSFHLSFDLPLLILTLTLILFLAFKSSSQPSTLYVRYTHRQCQYIATFHISNPFFNYTRLDHIPSSHPYLSPLLSHSSDQTTCISH